ncbi:MAG: radical SAM protein, partial [Candidatus Omnitrophota bacterium]
MRALFVYTNIKGFHDDCFAFGLASIVSIARKNGHEAKVTIVRKKEEYSRVLDDIKEFNPKLVGFTAVSSQFGAVKDIASNIKDMSPGIITICGGVHPTINPQCLLESKALDGIFIGESEHSFIEFLDKIDNGRPYQDTDNFAYVKDGKVVANRLKPLINNLDDLPPPDREVYPFEDTLKISGYAPFFFSRGCPFLCSYCSNHTLAKCYGLPKNFPRQKSAELSIREIEDTVKRFNVKTVWLLDDIFGMNKKWRQEFCEKYKKRVGIKFICQLRVTVIDDEFIKLLKDTGCYRIQIGVESGNEYIRNEVMNRRMSQKQIIDAAKIIKKYGIQMNTLNIIGVPGETEEMLWDTIKLNRKIAPTSSGVNVFYPYRGTKLGDYC